jgi:tetratricopeptide (TPR) repeat protein
MDRASTGLALLACLAAFAGLPRTAHAQSEARERQAAAEAYDQGTASYVSGDYPKAAEWFETAHRLSPAAPALIQAARAHQQAGNSTRAATLALRLTLQYPDETSAVQYAQGVLQQLAPKFLRIEVVCAECSLDVDGTLQEFESFFVEPDVEHTVTASFETGERRQKVDGAAGETRTLEFQAPPPAAVSKATRIDPTLPVDGPSRKPLGPAVTFVAGGITVLLLAGSIVSHIDMEAGVGPYKDSIDEYNNSCRGNMPADDAVCNELYADAEARLAEGRPKEDRTTILWIATGGAAAATAVIGLLLTDWSGSGEDKALADGFQLSIAPTIGGASLLMKGNL